MKALREVILGILASLVYAVLAWLTESWEGKLFIGILALGTALWWFHSKPAVRLAFNLVAPAIIAILLLLLPRYFYTTWATCLAPWLPQLGTPCLLVQGRLEVSSIINGLNSRPRQWFKSSKQDGPTEIVSELDESFSGQERFLNPVKVIRTYWKYGHLIARDELPPEGEQRWQEIRTYYHSGCVIAADFMRSNGIRVASGWDPTCQGNLRLLPQEGITLLPLPLPPAFLPLPPAFLPLNY